MTNLLIHTDAVQESQFLLDCIDETKQINVNGVPTARGYYNLIISKRDFGLFALGMKPNRHWKFNDTKKYFGLKGNAKKVSEQINQLLEEIQELNK